MRFKFIKQHDSMQCGIACLSMVCNHFGRNYTLDYLSKICNPTTEGVSLLALKNAAQDLGFDCLSGIISIEKIQSISLPCIIHWNQNHFVVLYKIKNSNKFYIADPAKGRIIYNKHDLIKHWCTHGISNSFQGIVLILTPSDNFYSQKLEQQKTTSIFIFEWVFRYKKPLLQVLLGLLLGVCLQLIIPFLMQSIVDLGIYHRDIKLVWLILLGELFIVLGLSITDLFRRWIILHLSIRTNLTLVGDYFRKLLRLPMFYFETKMLGDLFQRIEDYNRIQNFLTEQILNFLFILFNFITFGIVLYIFDKIIFGIFILSNILYCIWIIFFLPKRKVLDYTLFEQQAINQNQSYQFITSIQEIKLHDCEKRRCWEWEDTQAELFNIKLRALKLLQTQETGSVFIKEVKNILITIVAATAVINGYLSLGTMMSIQYIIGQLNSPVDQFMSLIYSLQDVKISLNRITDIYSEQNEDTTYNQLIKFGYNKSISVNNVTFKYDPIAPKNTIDNISFNIPECKVTAIVGASGCGKTTLIKLLLGYYPISSGSIMIAGYNINEYNLKWLRNRCGVVMQDGVIFSESIARNIAVSDDDIDEVRLEEAAKISNIHDFIIKLPLGYNTKIGSNGMGLSKGQRQRILIARAVYKSPDYIFLDEATNALDAKNERDIIKNLRNFYDGRTVVVIAHRLSTIKDADQIVVFDNGSIAEIGNHSSLLKQKGVYYNLVRNQL